MWVRLNSLVFSPNETSQLCRALRNERDVPLPLNPKLPVVLLRQQKMISGFVLQISPTPSPVVSFIPAPPSPPDLPFQLYPSCLDRRALLPQPFPPALMYPRTRPIEALCLCRASLLYFIFVHCCVPHNPAVWLFRTARPEHCG